MRISLSHDWSCDLEYDIIRSREWSGEVITDFRELFSLSEHEQQHTEVCVCVRACIYCMFSVCV